jgi:hypothetical protein
MEPSADGTLAAPDEVGVVVVEAEAGPEDLLEVREDRLVVDERPDRRSPVEDIAEPVGRRIRGDVTGDPLVHQRIERRERVG